MLPSGVFNACPPAPRLLRGLVHELDSSAGELRIRSLHVVDVEDEVGEATQHRPCPLVDLGGHVLGGFAENQACLGALGRELNPAALTHRRIHLQLEAQLLGVEGKRSVLVADEPRSLS
jgi:hypothetical protein